MRDLDLVGCSVIEIDSEGRVRRVNRAAERLLGKTEAELAGSNFFEDHLPRRMRHRARAALPEGEATILPVLDANSAEHSLLWKIVTLVDGGAVWSGIEQLGEIALELGDVKRALDASTIVAITDPAGTITYVNDKFIEISKYSREELLGQNHRIINSGHHPQSFFKAMYAAINHGKVWQGDIKNRAKDGSYYWVATTIVPFLDERGKVYQHLALRHEITERKQAEESLLEANRRIVDEQRKLIQAEKLSSIGLLVAGIAHEVNNPLSGVLGCVKALRDHKVTDDRRAEYFRTALEGLERIQQTMRGMLDFSRQRPAAPEPIEIADVLASALRLIAPALRKKDLRIESSIDPIDLAAQVDRAQLLQALVNVLLNAVYVSPPRSTIAVEGTNGGTNIHLKIRDHGPGIAPDVIDKVCDPFFSTKPEGEGTGLGLSITLGLLRSNGGDLLITSDVGVGTEVTFLLPIAKDIAHARSTVDR